MAKAQINFGELGGGGEEYVYIDNVSFPAGTTPSYISTPKRAKRFVLGCGYGTTSPAVLMAEDGDTSVYANNSASATLSISSWEDNKISFSGYYSQYTAYTLCGYIIY